MQVSMIEAVFFWSSVSLKPPRYLMIIMEMKATDPSVV